MASQAASTRSRWATKSASERNGALNSVAKRAAMAGVRRLPAPPTMIGTPRSRRRRRLHRLGQGRRVGHVVVLAVELVAIAERRRPHPGEDRRAAPPDGHPLAERGERNRVRLVLGLVPAGAEAELDATTRHLVDAGHLDGQDAGLAERGRRDERAQPDRRGVAGETGERRPRVGRSRDRLRPPGPSPSRGSGRSGRRRRSRGPRPAGDGQQVVVRGALLGFGEDAQLREVEHGRHPRVVIRIGVARLCRVVPPCSGKPSRSPARPAVASDPMPGSPPDSPLSLRPAAARSGPGRAAATRPAALASSGAPSPSSPGPRARGSSTPSRRRAGPTASCWWPTWRST